MRPRKPIDPSATLVRRRPSLDFSLTGLVYCSMMLFMGLAAMNSQANLLFGVFGLMIGILLVSGVISNFVLRRIDVARVLPEHGVVGQTLTVVYEFNNSKKFWPSLSVTVAELDGAEAFVKQPHGYLLHAAPKMTARVPVELIPKRRGLHKFDRHQISTSFPFGFIKRALERRREDHLLIFPAMAAVDPKLLSMMQSAESSGPMMRPRRGGVDEFYGLKEHRFGENPRYIYWKRSARTGTLVAKEMTHVSPPRLVLLVDTYTEGKQSRDTDRAIEKCIAMAASLASHALEQNLPVGLFMWSDGWVGIAPNRGKRQRLDILTALSRAPRNDEHGTRELIDGAYEFQESGTTQVLFSPRDIQLGLGESARGGMMVISSMSPMSDRWFKFDKKIDFAHAGPIAEEGTEARRHGGTKGKTDGA
jgi:uncharacterized protein (DUF58 family)